MIMFAWGVLIAVVVYIITEMLEVRREDRIWREKEQQWDQIHHCQRVELIMLPALGVNVPPVRAVTPRRQVMFDERP